MTIKATSKISPDLIAALVGGKGVPVARGLGIHFRPSAKGTISFDVTIHSRAKKVLNTILEVRDEKPENLGSIELFNLDKTFTFKIS